MFLLATLFGEFKQLNPDLGIVKRLVLTGVRV